MGVHSAVGLVEKMGVGPLVTGVVVVVKPGVGPGVHEALGAGIAGGWTSGLPATHSRYAIEFCAGASTAESAVDVTP